MTLKEAHLANNIIIFSLLVIGLLLIRGIIKTKKEIYLFEKYKRQCEILIYLGIAFQLYQILKDLSIFSYQNRGIIIGTSF
jgi:hypothetical protein